MKSPQKRKYHVIQKHENEYFTILNTTLRHINLTQLQPPVFILLV